MSDHIPGTPRRHVSGSRLSKEVPPLATDQPWFRSKHVDRVGSQPSISWPGLGREVRRRRTHRSVRFGQQRRFRTPRSSEVAEVVSGPGSSPTPPGCSPTTAGRPACAALGTAGSGGLPLRITQDARGSKLQKCEVPKATEGGCLAVGSERCKKKEQLIVFSFLCSEACSFSMCPFFSWFVPFLLG